MVSGQWAEGRYTTRFEDVWSERHRLPAISFSSWAGAALAVLEFFHVRDRVVLCPSNSYMAVPLVTRRAGGRVKFVDCRKDDLCMAAGALREAIDRYHPRLAWVVHIGGHLAFDIEEIAQHCAEKGVVLVEDCAHAHGASWNGRQPASWGAAGIYSFYATKRISTGEGGMLVTANPGECFASAGLRGKVASASVGRPLASLGTSLRDASPLTPASAPM